LLSPETNEAYRNAGLSHLLAISGLHLSVLVAMLRKLLFAFRLRKQVREVIALLVILLYCFLTGFSPSIVRAAVMVGFVLA
jgi:competence protein ComEC